jgi:hypothetical protein
MASNQPFPSLKPSSRVYNPGTYPQNIFEAQNGAKTIIRYSQRRVNATLTLGFSNITDAQAGLIIQNYDDVNADWSWVQFTTETGAAGIDGTGSGNLLEKEIVGATLTGGDGTTRKGLKWRYSKPPTVTSVFPGRCNVSCSFVACLDAP